MSLVYLIAATAIGFSPGRFSLDALLGLNWNGRIGAVAALGVGIIVAVGDTLTREIEAPAETSARPQPETSAETETQELPGDRRGRAA